MTMTETTKKTTSPDLAVTASTSHAPQPLMQPTANRMEEDDDDFFMLLETMTMLTTMPTTETTEMTEKLMIHDPAAIAFTSPKLQPLPQSTDDIADNDDDNF